VLCCADPNLPRPSLQLAAWKPPVPLVLTFFLMSYLQETCEHGHAHQNQLMKAAGVQDISSCAALAMPHVLILVRDKGKALSSLNREVGSPCSHWHVWPDHRLASTNPPRPGRPNRGTC
jgi:hypothetical protein